MKISVIILTKNEEQNLGRVIESANFCDEIIVIDDFSDDKTIELAKELGATVYERKLDGNFAKQRNFAMEKAKGEWLFFLDADEEVTKELINEIKNAVAASEKTKEAAFYIKRRDFWWGRELKHGEVSKVRNRGLIRLIKRNSGSWLGSVHEIFQTNSSVGRLKNFINHYPHPTVKTFLEDINFYSTLRAKELFSKGKKVSLLEILSYPLGKFVSNYFIKQGFLDGPAGFAYAFLMSFHSFLVRAKLYQYSKL